VRPEYAKRDQELARAYALDPINASSSTRELLTIEPRLVVEASFTADHRAVEGVELARLVKAFKDYCESPSLLIAELV
jgi:2-oxoisovalerate dehydrogenase E2 component (dihydrolipoyl transacylase)